MKTNLRILSKVLVFWAVAIVSAAAEEENERLVSFREAFEKRMNAELDEHGEKARTLRIGYLEALQRLKAELGREEKLKEAVQVVAELEAVEGGEEAEPLPKDADYRLKRLRQKWEEGLEGILRERGKQIETTAKLYLKALDDEKRKLTRAGQIKEALLFEEEQKRVQELPEVKGVLEVDPPPAATDEFPVGTEWVYATGGGKVLGSIQFVDSEKVVFSWRPEDKIKWKRLASGALHLKESSGKRSVFVIKMQEDEESFVMSSEGRPIGSARKK